MPRAMSDQPGMTASSCPPSMTATPSPSSNHSARSVLASSGGRPAGCLVCAVGISGVWPAFSRDRSALCGACSWLAIHAAPSTAPASCRYAAVVAPSYSTTSRRLAYGLSLSSTVPGWPPIVAGRGPLGRLRIEDMPEIYRFLTILQGIPPEVAPGCRSVLQRHGAGHDGGPGHLGHWKGHVFAAARLRRPAPRPATAPSGRPVGAAARRGGGRARRKTAAGQATFPALLRPAERGCARHDRHPAALPCRPGGRTAAAAADRGPRGELR